MHRNLFFILLTIIFLPVLVVGKSVNVSDARLVAKHFYYERIHQYQTLELSSINIITEQEKLVDGQLVAWYFNMYPDGFVIVSAEDKVVPVLGYSFKGFFTSEHRNPAYEAWMKLYADQILYIRKNALPAADGVAEEWSRLLRGELMPLSPGSLAVEPLLTTQWDQGYIYNALCPADPDGPGGHVWAGCVATAMAQVMNYFKYPISGNGSHGYYSNYGWEYADFGSTTYDWNAMVNKPTSSNSAIATLLYHCGVAVEMGYSPNGSGASMYMAEDALVTYFKYHSSTSLTYQTGPTWKNLLKANLDSLWPIAYAGYPSGFGSGHAFVCDGYQGTDYFHFNWGWSGSYDGYFYITALNPGTYDFTSGQQAILNARPASEYPYYCQGSKTLTALNGVFEDGSGYRKYKNNTECYYLIAPQLNVSNLQLSFDRFELASGDEVTVYDGDNTSAPILGTFTGNVIPASLTSSGNRLLVKFTSNASGVAQGFHASYKGKLVFFCSSYTTLTAISDTLSDGSGPDNYYDGSLCKWMIEPPNASSITLNFLSFDVEAGDLLSIFNPATSPSTLLGQFSGNTIPPAVYSPSGKMYLLFFTNSSDNADGFKAVYTATVGMNESSASNGIKVFPVPVVNELNLIVAENISQVKKLIIFDVSGRQVVVLQNIATTSHHQIKIPFDQYQSGLYFVQVFTDNECHTIKVIKQ